jgi:hypothetical protein
MRREYHVLLLSDPTAILREIRTENCFDLKSKVLFTTDRLQPNLHRLQRMRRDYHVVLFSDATTIIGVKRTKIFSDIKGKVPVTNDRLQPNLHCFYAMRREYHVVTLSDPNAILGEIRTRNCFWIKSKVLSLLTDFNVTSTACSACKGSTNRLSHWPHSNHRRDKDEEMFRP